MSKYIPPTLHANAFSCPQCQIFAQQDWFYLNGASDPSGFGRMYENKSFLLSKCVSCGAPTIWHDNEIIFPVTVGGERASEDLPDGVRADFEEARLIANQSPRGAAALLRLAVQKLCLHLGESGKNINADVASLVAKGLPPKVQEALDSVRVIGNEAVHPGELDLRDDVATVSKLFRLINFIATKMITEPREIGEIYSGLPGDKLAAIAKRDAK